MKDLEKLHGKRFTAEIRDVPVEGRICYGEYSSKRHIFLCQNTKNGLRPDGNDMLGYKYGWMLEDFNNLECNSVTNLKIIELMTKEEIENYKDFKEGDLLCNESYNSLIKVDAVLNNIVFTIMQDDYQMSGSYSKTELYKRGWRLHVTPEEEPLPIVELTLEEIAELKGINVEQLRKIMETKNIKIDVPEGWEIDEEKSTFENIVFKKKEEKLPTKWEDFERIGGWYVSGFGSVETVIPQRPLNNKNIWPTKELAEASLALCQLIRYRDAWNKGWVPDWTNGDEIKFSIANVGNNVEKLSTIFTQLVLTFANQKLRDDFLLQFKNLLEIAKPLL